MNSINKEMFFTDYMCCWLELVKDTLKPSTYEGYEKVVNKINSYFVGKSYKLSELKGAYFTSYFSYLKKFGRSDGLGGLRRKAILNIRGVLSSAFTFALENELIEYNYIQRSRLPVFEKVDEFEPVVYSSEQLRYLLEYAQKENSKALLFLFLEACTGCRKGELVALSWDDIDFENKTVTISKNRSGCRSEVVHQVVTPKTKNAYRVLPLPSLVIDMLKSEFDRQNLIKSRIGACYPEYEYDYIIRKDDGSIYNPASINRIINRLILSAGLPPTRIHDLRHSVAQILFDSDVKIKDISTQLGHSDTRITEKIYLKRSNIAKKENADIISAKLGF